MNIQNNSGEASTIKWTIGSIRRQSNLFESVLANGMTEEYFGKTLHLPIGYGYRKVVDLSEYYYMPDYLKVEDYLRSQAQANLAFLENLVSRTYAEGERLLQIARDIQERQELPSLSNEQIAGFFAEYIEAALCTVPMAYAAFPIEQILEESIRREITANIGNSNGSEEIESYIYRLVSFNMGDTDYALLEERDLIATAARIQETHLIAEETRTAHSLLDAPAAVQDMVTQHAREFGWINTDGYLGEPWRPVDVFSRVQWLLNRDCRDLIIRMNDRRAFAQTQYVKAMEELRASDELTQLIQLTQQYVQVRPYRPMVLIKAGYVTRNLLSEVARRYGVGFADIVHYTYKEILDLLKGNFVIDRHNLEVRRQRRGYTVIAGKTEWYFGDDVMQIEENDETTDYSHIRELRGQIANKGMAVGRARLLTDLLNLPCVEQGDIVVASMTMPDMMPAMERAGAYITDEGGITCHAAIVSRELNVPCVIGTSLATRVIRDGDVVEVDANRGVVTVISRSASGI